MSAGIVGYFVGGEILSGVQIAGAGLILFGIVVSEVGSYYKNKRSRGSRLVRAAKFDESNQRSEK